MQQFFLYTIIMILLHRYLPPEKHLAKGHQHLIDCIRTFLSFNDINIEKRKKIGYLQSAVFFTEHNVSNILIFFILFLFYFAISFWTKTGTENDVQQFYRISIAIPS